MISVCGFVMVKMPPPKLVSPRTNFSKNNDPGTSFTAKNGLPLKNLDHLPQMKKHRPWTFFVCKIWTSGLSRVIEVSGNCSGAWVHQHTMYCTLIPSGTTRCIHFHVHCTIFVNAAQGQLKEYWWKPVIQSLDMPLWTPLMSSVLHDRWRAQICLDVAIYSRNKFSEWVQIFQKNSFRREPILGGGPKLFRFAAGECLSTLVERLPDLEKVSC